MYGIKHSKSALQGNCLVWAISRISKIYFRQRNEKLMWESAPTNCVNRRKAIWSKIKEHIRNFTSCEIPNLRSNRSTISC